MDKMDFNPFCAYLTRYRASCPGGPRQVGKTTFALGLLGEDADENHPAYLNWDHPSVPPILRKAELPPSQPLLLLDEIHKYARWRNLLKGIYDTEKSRRKILVPASQILSLGRRHTRLLDGAPFS